MRHRPIAAYQLSLFGEPPVPGYQWRPSLFVWCWAGLNLPPDDAALKQFRMMGGDVE
jgi:hypothetical protein